jgi:hypothetical protein
LITKIKNAAYCIAYTTGTIQKSKMNASKMFYKLFARPYLVCSGYFERKTVLRFCCEKELFSFKKLILFREIPRSQKIP